MIIKNLRKINLSKMSIEEREEYFLKKKEKRDEIKKKKSDKRKVKKQIKSFIGTYIDDMKRIVRSNNARKR